MDTLLKLIVSSVVLIVTAFVSHPVLASVEWNMKRELNLEATPLDMASSPDGKMIYLLVPGRIMIYSIGENRVLKSMPIDNSADMLVSAKDNSFVVGIRGEKKLKVYQMETREKIDASDLPFIGPKDAPVTIAVFSDYQCPYCARLDTLIQQVLAKNKTNVKMVLKIFPLKFHPYGNKAALAALAANEQGKFPQFHEKLFANISSLSDDKIQEIARSLNIDMDTFNRRVQDPTLQAIVSRSVAEGERIGVNATPTVYVNGKLLKDRTVEGLQEMIDLELANSR